MAVRLRRNDMERRVAWALDKTARARGAIPVPLDLMAVCSEMGIDVEWRRMVPEGTFYEENGLLKIALQNNFTSDPARRKRLRFTHAHEVCHALVHGITGCPSGAALEDLCQYGAGVLLIPQGKLEEIHGLANRLKDLDSVWALATNFDVSLDVVVNRLHHNEVLGEDYAIVVARRTGTSEWVSAVAHGSWLPENVRIAVGGDYAQWNARILKSARQIAENRWELGTSYGDLHFSQAKHDKYRTVIELRRQ